MFDLNTCSPEEQAEYDAWNHGIYQGVLMKDSLDATCSDNPGTGKEYTCYSLLCPIHGEHNKEHGKTEEILMKFCPRCNKEQEMCHEDYGVGPEGNDCVYVLECGHHISLDY